MKNFFLILILTAATLGTASAATVGISSTEQYDGSIKIMVTVDPEGTSVNAVGGTISIPKEYFDIGTISTGDSIVPFWLERPAVSDKVDWSGLSHLHFEGAIPGGFSGIRSPYYEGAKPGTIFSFTVRPKKLGKTLVLLDEADLFANDGNASRTHMEATSFPLTIERLAPETPVREEKRVRSDSLAAFSTKNDLVANGAWTLVFGEDETRRSVDHYEVAESDEYYPDSVGAREWHRASSPYVLLHQKRDVFAHVKAVYSDDTYATLTLPPVENIATNSYASSILILIALSLVLLYALYAYRKRGR
jgi:hypothetical protein